MAKDMIEKIASAEKEGENLIKEAEQKATAMLEEAKEEALRQYASVCRQTDADFAKIIDEANESAKQIAEAAVRRGWAEGEKLSAIADKKREEAVSLSTELIFS